MNVQPSIDSIIAKIGPLPAGFSAHASTSGVGQVTTDDWCVCIRGFYNGQQYDEMYYVTSWQLAFLSSVRDKLMLRHWERMCSLLEPSQLAEFFRPMHPYSSMEMLHHAPR